MSSDMLTKLSDTVPYLIPNVFGTAARNKTENIRVEFLRRAHTLMQFDHACDLAASEIYDSHKNLYLALSGGSDSDDDGEGGLDSTVRAALQPELQRLHAAEAVFTVLASSAAAATRLLSLPRAQLAAAATITTSGLSFIKNACVAA